MKVIIASTAVGSVHEVSEETLVALKKECFNKPFIHEGKLYFIYGVEEILIDGTADYALIADLKPATFSTEVTTECTYCFRAIDLKPEDVTVFGVSLLTCLRDDEFMRRLVRLMKAQGIDVYLYATLRGTVNQEEETL